MRLKSSKNYETFKKPRQARKKLNRLLLQENFLLNWKQNANNICLIGAYN